MNKYKRIFTNQINVSLVYKWNLISGFFIQLLQIFTFLFVWRAIFINTESVGDYNINSMTEYIILIAMIGVVFSSEHIFRMTALVRNGGLSNILIRPYSYHIENFMIYLGKKVVELFILLIIIIILFLLGFLDLKFLSGSEIILLLSNFFLLYLFGSFIGNLSFWIIQMWPLKPLYISLMALLGGGMFPLDLLPEPISSVIKVLPFSLFGYVNTLVLQGKLSPGNIQFYTVISLGWIIIFAILYRFTWKLGLKKYESVNI